MNKHILIIGTADTKSDELVFMRQTIERMGGTVSIMDVSVLGDSAIPVDYTKHQVAEAVGTTNAIIAALGDENKSMTATAAGAVALVLRLCAEGKINGVMMLGGTMGTDLALDVAEALPFGLPKMILSTVAFSHLVPPERLSADLMMMLWSGGLYGLNSICESVLAQACGAIYGAALAAKPLDNSKPLIAMTSLGSSALTYMIRLKPALEARGFEVAVFHATGSGGRALEALAEKKRFALVLDLCLAELANESVGSIVTSGSNRLEAASRAGIPQIVAGAGLGFIDIPTWKPVSEDYTARGYHAHNRLIASVTMSPEEMQDLAKLIADKMRLATAAPAVFLTTLHGLMDWDREGSDLCNPPALHAFNNEIAAQFQNHPAQNIVLDTHTCDDAFAEAILKIVDDWVAKGVIVK
jgi:uncharacterized protein (UPF0261 family)